MKEECLICKAPLEYLETDEMMECAICHKKEMTKARCISGHYVCNDCHTSGMDAIIGLCLQEKSKNPVQIIEKMMDMPFCHMHGPEHHVMIGAALLTAYKNADGELDLEKALQEMYSRGKKVPGGVCGFWGSCGAGISSGMYMSIITGANPLAKKEWSLSNQMTARSLTEIAKHGGPRCCKRNSYLAITEAVRFTEEQLGIRMELDEIVCSRSAQNNQCLHEECPYNPINHKPHQKTKVAFICVHNSCRSQMAEALGKKYLSDICDCYSAGTETKPQINQDAVRLMKQEYGIDMEKEQYSKLFEDIPEPDIVVSMGCNVVCPYLPGKLNLNWGLEDPTGQSDEKFLEIMKRIDENVRELRETILEMR